MEAELMHYCGKHMRPWQGVRAAQCPWCTIEQQAAEIEVTQKALRFAVGGLSTSGVHANENPQDIYDYFIYWAKEDLATHSDAETTEREKQDGR